MKLPLNSLGKRLSSIVLTLCLAASCVYINEELGKEYIPTRHQYDVYVDTIVLKNIRMLPVSPPHLFRISNV